MTTRRELSKILPFLLLPQAAIGLTPQPITEWEWNWQRFAEVWNPFVDKFNSGVFDAKRWETVRDRFHKIEGVKKCQ